MLDACAFGAAIHERWLRDNYDKNIIMIRICIVLQTTKCFCFILLMGTRTHVLVAMKYWGFGVWA